MKKAVSVFVLVCMLAGIIAGAVSFSAAAVTKTELGEQTSAAKVLYYGGGSEQTRKYLFDRISSAESVLLDDNAASAEIDTASQALTSAVEGFIPAAELGRTELNGFEHWSADEVAAMQADGLNVSVGEAAVANGTAKALELECTAKGAFFSNDGAPDGTYSPFGIDMNTAAGLGLWVSSDDYGMISAIDLYVGTKNAEGDKILSVYGIPVTKEGYIYVPWEAFYPEFNNLDATLDLSGGMNYIGIGLTAEAGAVLTIADLHAFVETVEEDDREYREVLVNNIGELKNDAIYKLVDAESGLTLTFGPMLPETEMKNSTSSRLIMKGSSQSFTMSSGNNNDVTQQWQIYKLPVSGKYHIVNQGTSCALTYNFLYGLTIKEQELLDDSSQQWGVTEADGRFSFKSTKYLGVSDGSPTLTNNADTEWLVYECVYDEWVEVWSDEFEGTAVDRTKWRVENGKTRGSGEPIYFRDSPNNVYVSDGNLVIKSIIEEYNGYHATSGWIDTQGLFAVTYGKIELRAKLTYGKDIWPAFWSMGQYGNWPYNGEMDIMEFTGDGAREESSPYATNHWWSYARKNNIAKGSDIYTEGYEPLSNDYHTFSIEWDETQMRTYFDGLLYMSLLMNTDEQRWSFGDNPHYLILNTSMKGPGNNEVYADTPSESYFYVDYVRCYKRSSAVAEVPTYNDTVITPETIVSGSDWMNIAEISPNGDTLLTTDKFSVYMTDTADNSLKKTIRPSGGLAISAVKFTEDSSLFAVADRIGNCDIYDSDGNLVASANSSGVFIEAIAFSKDKTLIYTGGRGTNEAGGAPTADPSVYINTFDTSTGALVKTTYVGSNVRNMMVSPDGSKLAVVCSSGKVAVYNTSDYSLYASFADHTRCVRGLDWSPDGTHIVTSDESGKICVFDIAGKSLAFEAATVSTASVKKVVYSPDGTRILASGSSDNARLFDASSGKLISVFGGFGQILSDVEWAPDGSKLAVSSHDGYIRVFTRDGGYKCMLDGRVSNVSNGVVNIAFSSDGNTVYGTTYKSNPRVFAWDIAQQTTDFTALKEALTAAYEVNPAGQDAELYGSLMECCGKYKAMLRMEHTSQSDADSAAATVRAATSALDGKIYGFEPWSTADTGMMSVTNCRATMRVITQSEMDYNALTLFSTRTSWTFYNDVSGAVLKNPYNLDLRDNSGLKVMMYASKDVTESKVYVGYTDGAEATVYSYSTGAISITPQEYVIPFAELVRVSGDEKLDLSKLETIGFYGKGKASTAVYCYDLKTYQEEGSVPVISGVVDGGEYDIFTAAAPVPTWDVGRGELNGEDFVSGAAIEQPGEYTLRVINLDKSVSVSFRVVDSTPDAIPGDLDGDGEITVSDALLCMRIAAQLVRPSEAEMLAADVDGTAGISVNDALMILRCTVGLAEL